MRIAKKKPEPDSVRRRNLDGYGLKIKKYRKAAGISAEELASVLGVGLSSVRNWECGLSRPDPEYLYQLFPVLGVAPNEFFGIEGVGEALTGPEKTVVGYFRAMDSRGREDYLAIGEKLAERCHLRKLREVSTRIIAFPDYGAYASAGTGDGWTDTSDPDEIFLYRDGPAAEADEIITVSGHSMEPVYHDHDRLLVKHCTEVEPGKVYVFSLNGMGLMVKEAGVDRLHSLNEEYEDIVPWEEDGAKLIGRVLGVIGDFMYPTREEIELYREARETLK